MNTIVSPVVAVVEPVAVEDGKTVVVFNDRDQVYAGWSEKPVYQRPTKKELMSAAMDEYQDYLDAVADVQDEEDDYNTAWGESLCQEALSVQEAADLAHDNSLAEAVRCVWREIAFMDDGEKDAYFLALPGELWKAYCDSRGR